MIAYRELASSRALDIAHRYPQIRRLICSHPAFRAAVAAGVDADDLRQDVLLRLVAMQHGSGRYDARRSSIARYTWLVTWCAVANHRRDQRRHLRPDEDQGTTPDAVTWEHGAMSPEAQLHRACAELGLGRAAYELVLQVATGQLRRDDGRVTALGALVRDRLV